MGDDARAALQRNIHALPSSWSWEWFTDILDIRGGTQPPASEFVDAPQPGYVRLVQIRDFDSDSHITYIPDSPKWRRCADEDVLIARYGAALGRICTGLSGAYNVALAKVIPSEKVHLPFVYYLLKSDYFQKPLLASGGRSAQAGFNKSGLSVISLPLPPLHEQRAIAHVLGTLDDKIELNRRMNETHERMARALFKSWFVDFEPVRAKMEGRPTGLPLDLDALFPDALVESPLGEIPVGWEVVPFGDILSDSIGGDWGKEEADETHTEPISVIRGTDMGDLWAGGVGKVPLRYTTAKKLDRRRLRHGDVIIEVSGGSPTQPTGRSLFIHQSILDRFSTDVVCASFCRRFRPMNLVVGMFAAQHLDHLYHTGGTWSYQNQSTGISNFQTTYFLKQEKIVLPGNALLQEYSTMVEPLFQKIAESELLVLANLRDMLLPKLISGQLQLSEPII